MTVAPAMSADEMGASDPRRIRALTHPVRIALLDALALHGALTATEAGERIGESATTCSFHLRQLARYGFVADAGEPGRRERPWRLLADAVSLPRPASLASAALESMLQSRSVQRWDAWRRHSADFGEEWVRASPFRSWVLHMTPEELHEFDVKLTALVESYAERRCHPHAAVPVQITAYGHPLVEQRPATEN